MKIGRPSKDITGKRFSKLTAIKFVKKIGFNKYYWLVKCDCGTIKEVQKSSLVSGCTVSCGCHKRKLVINRNFKHGMSGTRFYKIYKAMNTRCKNPTHIRYNRYGGRGIKVCNRWENFINFKKDMYKDYIKHVKDFGENNTSIDRVNNNGNYSLKNCRWATNSEQMSNTHRNHTK